MTGMRMLELFNAVGILFLCMVMFLMPRGGDPARLVDAERLYSEGVELAARDDAAAKAKFRESAAIIEAQLADEDAAGMHFNRANALVQSGDLGDAIASYLAAQQRSPADTRIATNLGEARARILRPLGSPESTALEKACMLWSAVSENTRLLVFLCLGVVALLIPKGRASTARIACIVAATLIATTVAADMVRRASANLAVVTESTTIRKGNGDGFEQVVAEALPEGTELRVREARPGWIEVELSGGTRGWVKDSAIVRVK